MVKGVRAGLWVATLLALLASGVPAQAKDGGDGRQERSQQRNADSGEDWRFRRDSRRDRGAVDARRGDGQHLSEPRRQSRQLSPEERRQLRRDVLEANRDFGDRR